MIPEGGLVHFVKVRQGERVYRPSKSYLHIAGSEKTSWVTFTALNSHQTCKWALIYMVILEFMEGK